MSQQISKDYAEGLIYSSLLQAIHGCDLSKYLGSRIYRWVQAEDNYQVINHILNQWECFDGDRICLDKLPNPVLVRPCHTLAVLYNANGKPEPDIVWDEIDSDPGTFYKAVYTYRIIYDLLFNLKLLTMSDVGGAEEFLTGTSLYQLDDLIQQNHGVEV